MDKQVNEIDYSKEYFSMLFPELDYNNYKELACLINLNKNMDDIKKLLPRYLKITIKGKTKQLSTVFKLSDIESMRIIDHYKLVLTGSCAGESIIRTDVKLSVHKCYLKDSDTLEPATESEFNDRLNSILQKV